MNLRLRISQIRKSHNGDRVLDDCSFFFEQGGVYVLTGPNGSGKSTLLRICALLERPDSGEIAYFLGQERLEDNIFLRRRVTLVLPQVGIFNTSVFNNISYGLRVRGAGRSEIEQKTAEMLAFSGLTQKRGQNAPSLSSGEKQRMGIARGLVIEPEMLFLDEPTASIDETNTRLIEEMILEKKKQGITMIITTHDRAQAERLADKLLMIRDKKLVSVPA
ncbi:MAG: ATP-binding cassette domain-containing protein [Nitrospirae bacterium]|nr:MAG: ATP-binding cassette domain-containing protein [Nitrospirota bacterium]